MYKTYEVILSKNTAWQVQGWDSFTAYMVCRQLYGVCVTYIHARRPLKWNSLKGRWWCHRDSHPWPGPMAYALVLCHSATVCIYYIHRQPPQIVSFIIGTMTVGLWTKRQPQPSDSCCGLLMIPLHLITTYSTVQYKHA